MKLYWLGHACFLLEQDGYTVLLDPYTGVGGYPPLYVTAVRTVNPGPAKDGGAARLGGSPGHGDQRPEGTEPKIAVNKVLCSHEHGDHHAVELTELLPEAPCPFTIRTVETFHDGQGGALRGNNTVHILTAGGISVAHLGDLGHQLSAEQVEAIGPLDAVLIPVGGYFTIDAKEAKAVCDALRPKCVIPMHYRHWPYGLPVVGKVEDFLALWPQESARRLDGPYLDLDEGPSGVVVPRFRGED